MRVGSSAWFGPSQSWVQILTLSLAPGYTASEFLSLSASLLLGGWQYQPVRVCGNIKWAEVHKKLDTEFGTEVEPIGVAYLFGGLYTSANVILTKMLWSRHYYQTHFRDKETEAQGNLAKIIQVGDSGLQPLCYASSYAEFWVHSFLCG